MKKPLIRFLVFILTGTYLLTGCGSGKSSGPTTTIVTGVISIGGVAVAQNTSVRLENTTNSSVKYTTTTNNSSGGFTFSNVTPGNYYIFFSPTGYTDLTDGLTKVVTLSGSNNFAINITLPPAPPGP